MRARKRPPDGRLLQSLVDTQELVGLQAELPQWMRKTVVDRGPGMDIALRVIQRLQVEMGERECLESLRLRVVLNLWIDEFQFVT